MSDTETTRAWTGRDLADEASWMYRFSDADIAELEAACAPLAGQGATTLDGLTGADFSLPRLGDTLAGLVEEIESGRGFAFMRGLPVERWGTPMSRLAYWGISSHVGRPISQNARGKRLVAVTDMGISKDDPRYRGNQGLGELYFHSDFADVVGLLCLRGAKSGGTSRICSSAYIVQRMLAERPEFAKVFERGFHFFRKGEENDGELPTSPHRLPMLDRTRDHAHPDFLFWPHFAKWGATMAGEPLSDTEAAAIAYVNDMAHQPGIHLDTRFQPGDIQYLNNYRVLHSRTDYEDWPEPDRKRYLERIWLCTDETRRFARGFADLYGENSVSTGIQSRRHKAALS